MIKFSLKLLIFAIVSLSSPILAADDDDDADGELPKQLYLIPEVNLTVSDTRYSDWSNKTLINDTDYNTTFSYGFRTVIETYEDGSEISYLDAVMNLTDLQTFYMNDGDSVIRMSVGWRNPQEDAYDITSINLLYYEENYLVDWQCEDGYSNGSQDGTDQDGRQNTTIVDWTSNTGGDQRVPEANDCQINTTDSAITARPTVDSTVSDTVRQNITARYRKPFVPSSVINDIILVPDMVYNLTSFYGCYSRVGDSDNWNTNPDVFIKKDVISGTTFGCNSKWQAEEGEYVRMSRARNGWLAFQTVEGEVETQVSVYLSEGGYYLKTLFSVNLILIAMTLL